MSNGEWGTMYRKYNWYGSMGGKIMDLTKDQKKKRKTKNKTAKKSRRKNRC